MYKLLSPVAYKLLSPPYNVHSAHSSPWRLDELEAFVFSKISLYDMMWAHRTRDKDPVREAE